MSKRRLVLTGCALGALAILLVLPWSGWLVRRQVATSLGVPTPTLDEAAGHGPDRETKRRAALIARHPDDFALQLANAYRAGKTAGPTTENTERQRAKQLVARLRALTSRFPDRPALLAAILRAQTAHAVRIDRDDETALLRPLSKRAAAPTRSIPTPNVSAPDDLAAFDEAAARGERLDPGNAFFPLMRATGLFAAHRDNEAVAAVLRAGAKPHWNDYVFDEIQSAWHLTYALHGETGTLARVSQSAAILFPHNAQLRAAARLATTKAVTAELAGQANDGLLLRAALTRCGALMRVESSTLIGSLVGQAIERTAWVRPGGAPALTEKYEDDNGDALTAARLEAYCAYLTQIGHADEARYVRAEAATRTITKRIWERANERDVFGQAWMFGLLGTWAAGTLTLGNAVATLLLGGLAALLARTRRVRSGEPLHPGVWAGFLLALFVPLLTIGLSSVAIPDTLALALGGGGVGFFLLVALGLRRGQSLRSWGGRLLVLFATLAGVGAASALVVFLTNGPRTFAGFTGDLLGMSNPSAGGGASFFEVASWLLATVLYGGALLVPLLLLMVLAVASRVARVPVSVGLVRGMRGLALPVASVLLLVYAGITLATLDREAVARRDVVRSVGHEGRYLAGVAGESWPGFVTAP